MVTLIDFSQIALGSVFSFAKQLDIKASETAEEKAGIVRHVILSSLKNYNKKFGELILACDGKQYWRKVNYPFYKASRAKARAASTLDWALVFNTISTLREDLIAHFPFKVIYNQHYEGDDIIGTLCKWFQTNELIQQGLVEDVKPITIISSDSDFYSLHKYKSVRQWSPLKQKFVVCPNPEQYLLEKIARGDVGDGIPNVLSADNVLMTEGVRQNKMTAKKLALFIERGKDACENQEQILNWDRNDKLINLERIPKFIQQDIVNQYLTQTPNRDKMGVVNYLIANKCNMLLDDVEGFF